MRGFDDVLNEYKYKGTEVPKYIIGSIVLSCIVGIGYFLLALSNVPAINDASINDDL
jgi:hypothetical protein